MKLNDGIQMAKINYDTVMLKGGWDQVTPTLQLDGGHVRNSQNYEAAVTGGYTRISGYERLDGQTRPSDAAYKIFNVVTMVNPPALGATVTGGTSLATSIVIAVGTNFVVTTKQTGAYTLGENLNVGATLIGIYTVATAAMLQFDLAVFQYLASQYYRGLITAVPGFGPALGCVLFNDVVYAWRATAADHTKVAIYKSSTAGWVNVPLFNEISFTAGGTATPADGATLTQGGVTATVKRVVTAGGAGIVGAWTGSAVGRFIIDTSAGGNFAAGAATLTGGATVTLSGAQTAITIAAGGKYDFDIGSFVAGSNVNRIYGADGANRAFEFDGTVYVPITTGTTPDTPKYVSIHRNYLILSIQSSLVFSAVGLPYDYTAINGAGEIGCTDLITGTLVMPGSQQTATLLVTTRNNTGVLYGVGASSFQLIWYNNGAGCVDYAAQNMAETYIYDDRGVAQLSTTLNFGNFDGATLTANIKPFIESKRGKVSYATLNRQKSQYRVFFNDGTGLYITVVNQQLMGCMPMYFPDPVYQAINQKWNSGEEATFFCSTNGMVYQMEKGTSFDGVSLDGYITLNVNALGSPRLRKRFRKAAMEISGSGYAEFNFGYAIGYSSKNITQPSSVLYDTNVNVMNWDNFTWDNFTWDGNSTLPNEIEVVGTAENIAITIRSTTPYWQPFTLNSVILHYSGRRMMR